MFPWSPRCRVQSPRKVLRASPREKSTVNIHRSECPPLLDSITNATKTGSIETANEGGNPRLSVRGHTRIAHPFPRSYKIRSQRQKKGVAGNKPTTQRTRGAAPQPATSLGAFTTPYTALVPIYPTCRALPTSTSSIL